MLDFSKIRGAHQLFDFLVDNGATKINDNACEISFTAKSGNVVRHRVTVNFCNSLVNTTRTVNGKQAILETSLRIQDVGEVIKYDFKQMVFQQWSK